ncbi:autotransporter family protein [Fusobacterium varium]|uniref:autotransporter family protein n=4 Tax=Fusobacterium TaxID=848 RepID=UPI0018978845|nr:autotransporter outer membrane beta-barrel domain-containing protein [Fusobacterium varium]
MIEEIIKVVKRGNKKRGRNITIGAVVGFLLSCAAVMGADDNYLWIRENGGIIKFNTAPTIYIDGTDGKWEKDNPYNENSLGIVPKTYVNNILLSSSENNGKDDRNPISYGIRLSGDMGGLNFVNNGSLVGIGTDYKYNYGIHNSGTIGDITNTGLISGSGNHGIGIYNFKGTMGDITNTGLIIGYSGSTRGIQNNEGTIEDITNTGLMTTSSDVISNTGTIGGITNTGVINSSNYGIYNTITKVAGTMGNIANTGLISSSSEGIYNTGIMGDITNTGVIYGKTNAISNGSGGSISKINNYGILITEGSGAISNSGTITNTPENYGIYITGTDGKVSIDSTKQNNDPIIVGYDENRKEIKRNLAIENETRSLSFSGNKENHILNALKNTYEVTGIDDKVTGSIINAYETAVIFKSAENKKLTLSGTIVNGGLGINTNKIAISGSEKGDILILQSGDIECTINGEKKTVTQNTIVNGNINMEDGNDILTIENGTIINGTLGGGADNDTLNFNSPLTRAAKNDEINILHNISDFENININTNVTLFEKTIGTDLKVTGAGNITIGKNGVLTLRMDSTNKDTSSGKIVGHALSENTGKIFSADGGKLLITLNGAGNENVISFGDTALDESLITYKEALSKDKITFDTTLELYTIEKIKGTNDVKVVVRANLPDYINYPNLNKVYQGILSVKDLIGNFNIDSNENLSTFLGYLNDIYAGNPYSYSSELSRKSVGMFRDIAVESQFKPELNKWLIMGGLTHVDGGTKDTYYGKGYYTYDIGSSDMDTDTKITGAYMLGEYGVSDTLTYGVVIGGNKLKSSLSNDSKVDGDALYMGAYAKKYVGNLKVTGGLGLQYGDYDADRIAAGRGITETRSYSDNYNDMTYDIYLNGRYSHNIGENLFLEPYGTLSYTYIKQDSTDEGSKTLAIETDSKSFDYTAAKVGVDLKKVIPHEKGKSTLSAGVSYTRLLNGADEENITGRFKGGSDFDILVAHKNEHSIGLNAKYALELENGILFDVKGSYSFERDSHNGSGKNRNKGEWIAGTGLGYKF